MTSFPMAMVLLMVFLFLLMQGATGAAPTITAPSANPHTETVNENNIVTSTWSLTVTASQSPAPTGFTFSIQSQHANNYFAIAEDGGDVNSGTLSIASGKTLDYETDGSSYEVVVKATSDDTASDTATVTISILLNDLNDETPTLSAQTFSIDENQPPATMIDTVAGAADDDAGDILTYSLSGTDAAKLHIDPSTGKVYSVNAIDREAPTVSLTATITVTDGNSHSTTAALTVTINNLNDNTPICNPPISYATLDENNGQGVSVITVACTDADVTGNTIEYVKHSGDTANSFSIDSASGAITTTSVATDYETTNAYTLIIHAIDNAGGTRKTATATVYVHINDISETNMAWTADPSSASPSISENDGPGTTVHTLAATGTGTITYSITGIVDGSNMAASGTFVVNANTGVVKTATFFQVDGMGAQNTYVVSVRADDSGNPAASLTSTLTVTITDYNEHKPAFSSSIQSETIQEDATVNSVVATISAVTDSDRTTPTYTYAIASGNTAGKFSLDTSVPSSVKLKLAALIDVDGGDSLTYNVVITVADGGTTPGPLTGTTTILVTVTPVNGHTPNTPQLTPSTITIMENANIGTSIATIAFTDGDYGVQGQKIYSIEAGGASDHFTVDSSTGVITLKKLVDYETDQGPLEFVIKCRDNDASSPKSATTTITATLVDVNDNTPSCTPKHKLIQQNEGAGAVALYSLPCTDGDISAAHKTLTYTLAPTNSLFTMNANALETTGDLDYDTSPQTYDFTVTVSDGTYSTTFPIHVAVLPVNEGVPSFPSAPYQVNVAEDTAIGTSVGQPAATDIDLSTHEQGALVYSIISGDTNNQFLINKATAEISLVKALDRESAATHELVIKAIEEAGTNSVTVTFTVTVDDANDHYPACSHSVYSETLPENSADATALSTAFGCSDSDAGSNAVLTYSISGGNTGTAFSIAASTGVLSVADSTKLDIETTPIFHLTIDVTDGGGKVTQLLVEITLSNVNEHAPAFSSAPYTATIAENAALGHTVSSSIAATDADYMDGVVFSITSGNTDNLFKIVPTSGVIILNKLLDRETTETHTLGITATDKAASNTMTTVTTMTITVTDINDNTPVCSSSPYFISTGEDTAADTALQTITCTDNDATAPNNVRTYTIISGNDDAKYALDANSGVLSVASGKSLDYETTKRYDLVLHVIDGAVSGKLTAIVNVAIQVSPVNEATPVITNEPYSAMVSEDASVGTDVLDMTATDADDDDDDGTYGHAKLRWKITGEPTGHFQVDEFTGKLRVNGFLDRETKASYSFTVTVTDSDLSHIDQTTVTITITDVNDNPPKFTSTSHAFSIPEDTATETEVFTVPVTDPDIGANTMVSFSFTSGTNHADFTFNDNKVVVNSALDFETKPGYILTMEVADGGMPSLISTTTLAITITSVNEFDPVITNSVTTATIPEDTSAGSVVYTVTATDSDGGVHGQIHFEVLDTSGDKFYIVPYTGELYVAGPLDYETKQVHMVKVKARDTLDDSTVRSATVDITITLTDVNDNNPIFTSNNYQTSMEESLSIGTSVFTVTANDDDEGANAVIKYSIVDGIGEQDYAIDADTGVITTTTAAFDYEIERTRTIIVKAVDQGNPVLSSSSLVTVNILDSNDNAPVFYFSKMVLGVNENHVSTNFLHIAVSDIDSGDNAKLVYCVHDDPLSHFSFGAGGKLALLKPFNREVDTDYTVILCAEDQGTPPKTGFATIVITVEDENDNSPFFSSDQPATFTIDEDTAIGTSLFRVSASDRDRGHNGTITFSMSSINPILPFSIQEATGHVYTHQFLDREVRNKWELLVTVRDKGFEPLESSKRFTINVKDVNDNAPVYIGALSYCLALGTPQGVYLFTADATDADEGVNGMLSWFINKELPKKGHFSIESSTGKVHTTAPLNLEGDAAYKLELCASDLGVPRMQTCQFVAINVNGNCGHAGNFIGTVAEDAAIGHFILRVTWDKAPENIGAYYLTDATNRAAYFLAIGQNSGDITVANQLDYDFDSKVLEFQVRITAQGDSTTVRVSITVLDVNDIHPFFEKETYSAMVRCDIDDSEIITKVYATDSDELENGRVSYSFQQSEDSYLFQVDDKGNIKLEKRARLACDRMYNVTVGATDHGVPARSSLKPAIVNIRTFKTDVLLRIRCGIAKDRFLELQDVFLDGLQQVMKEKFGEGITAGIGNIDEQEVQKSARRLLQAEEGLYEGQTDVTIYGFMDENGGSFIDQKQLLDIFQSSSGDPSDILKGAAFSAFKIKEVSDKVVGSVTEAPTTEAPFDFLSSSVGQVVLIVGAASACVLIIVIVFLSCKVYSLRRKLQSQDDDDDDEDAGAQSIDRKANFLALPVAVGVSKAKIALAKEGEDLGLRNKTVTAIGGNLDDEVGPAPLTARTLSTSISRKTKPTAIDW